MFQWPSHRYVRKQYTISIPVTLNSFRILLTKFRNPLTSCAVLAVEHMSREDYIQGWKNFLLCWPESRRRNTLMHDRLRRVGRVCRGEK